MTYLDQSTVDNTLLKTLRAEHFAQLSGEMERIDLPATAYSCRIGRPHDACLLSGKRIGIDGRDQL
jgi:hypothetical protein